MTSAPETGDDVPRNNQERLAASLIDCLGRDSAIHVCKLNGWRGVLDVIIHQGQAVEP